jgi:hemolysin activation/secretion protein
MIDTQIKSGSQVGESDVDVVTAERGESVVKQVALDSYGNAYTGRWRASANGSWFNPASHGDVLSVNALYSGVGMNNGGASYESALNGQGLRAGASLSAMNY